ncbi:MAG TPA: desulfoferrodoxin [Candidatus Methanomethylophilaceae archaeon]|nr:desulfoferrodoxin [Candidatus Methanomethylophilaceae archaeon]
MASRNEIYLCEKCGNLVEVLEGGVGTLTCCGAPMERLIEKKTDKGLEKHVPVLEEKDDGVLVKVGDVPHPMEEEHHIVMIELIQGDCSQKKFLKAGEAPQAFFKNASLKGAIAREYCNVHGLWKA